MVVDGAIDANAYAFEHLGGTGESAGFVLNGSATIVSFDHGAFDRCAVAAAGATAFVQLDAALIGAGTPSRQLGRMQFDNTTGLATCNVNAIGTAPGFWQITATGTFAGEGPRLRQRPPGPDDTPGRFAW